MTEPEHRTLHQPPRLAPILLRGALASPRKRPPYDGTALPGTTLTLAAARPDPARLRAYEEVCGFAPGDGELPPTYPHILGFPLAMRLMADRDFPFPLLGLVHTRIELTRRAPLRTSDPLTVSVRTEGRAPHHRGTEFGVVTRVERDGEEVWHSHSTYLCRHRTDTPQPSAAAPEPAPEAASAASSAPASTAAPVPAPLPVRATWGVPADTGRRYAAASGDRNPIHLHPLTARLFGFPRAIAHGMWTFARCLAATAPSDTGTGTLYAEADFKAPVLLPARVSYGAEESGSGGGGGGGRFELRSADGTAKPRLHLTGRVSSARP